ncbi:hypothetical protein JTB14_015344 [Gonioctena quinquepunctata]|nr:hypothetical protein JTB14_015344 [Gonioctena quinquepunctata]
MTSEGDARPVDDSVDHGNVNIDVSSNLSTKEAHGSEGTTTPDISEAEDAQKSTEHVCAFCNKNRKKYQGREQQLQTCATDESIVSLKRNVSEIGDVDLLNKITAEYSKASFYRLCEGESTGVSADIEPYNLENRLLDAFPKKIAVVSMNTKKVVKPYAGVLIKNDLETIGKQDILDRAVLILRSEIRDMERNPLPDKLTTKDLLTGECDSPKLLLDFYSKLICSSFRRKRNSNVTRLAESFSEDLIYAVSNGQIKPSKHINLGLALKSSTNSKKIINIINKYGHCCGYTVLEELETEATFSSTLRSEICPDDIIRPRSLCTGLAYNNFDRFVDTPTGKDTLHDTVGIIFQDMVDSAQ